MLRTPNHNETVEEAERNPFLPPRRFGRVPFSFVTAIFVLIAAALLLFGSQQYHGFAKNSDRSLLDDSVLPVQSVSAEIFPLMSGQKQRFEITSDPNKPELLNKIVQVKEHGSTKIAVMQTKYKDRIISERAYAISSKGITLLALSGKELMRFDPPLPLIHFPLKSSEIYSWRGKLIGKKSQINGSGLVRIGGAENLVQDKTQRLAYRVDLLLVTKNGGKANRQQTTLWFTPGTGLVREQSEIDGQPFICELISHTPAN